MAHKWYLPLGCIALVIIAMLPPITQLPYDPRNTQDVIFSVLMVSVQPYQSWGWIFHAATLLMILYIFWKPNQAGRLLSGYIGFNYLVIAAIQSHAVTEKYGFALLTGVMAGTAILGIAWIVVAAQNGLKLSLHNISPWKTLLLPLALLVFWSPIKTQGQAVIANFDPLLLLTSPDYGLAYCFATPVFLFLLILFASDHSSFVYRLSAFNALLYGFFNLTHWLNPNTRWMGVMHLPLLILSLVAFLLPLIERPLVRKPVLSPG